MNRKGDLATTLLTLMIVVLYITTIFIFYSGSGKVESNFIEPTFIDGAYALEKEAKFNINSAGERAFVNSYSDVASQGLFGKLNEGSSSSDDLKKVMAEKFFEYFKADQGLKDYSNYRQFENFEVSINENVVLKSSDFPISRRAIFEKGVRAYLWGFIPLPYKTTTEVLGAMIIYNPKLNFEFSFDKLGLEKFEKLKSALIACTGKESKELIENCLDGKLLNFDSSVSEVNGKRVIKFETKKSFIINGKSQKISFSL